MSENWHVGEFRESQTGEVAYYVCKRITEYLHKDGTVQQNTGASGYKYLCDAPGYWRTCTDAQAFLDKWLEENSKPKPKHGDVVILNNESKLIRIIVETLDGFFAYCFNDKYPLKNDIVCRYYQSGKYKVIGNVFKGFCQ